MFLKSNNLTNKNEQRTDLLPDKYTPYANVEHSILKEGLLFLLGNVFTLTLISTIVGTMLVGMNKVDKSGATVFISYSILFAILVGVLGTDIPKHLKKFVNWAPILVGIAFGVSMVLIEDNYMRFVNLFYTQGLGTNETSIRTTELRYPIASIFIYGLIGPMCEELTYRVGLFNLIKRWNRIAAYFISGLIFGFIHLHFSGNLATEFIVLPTYVFSGIMLAVCYDMYDLPCSYTAHITNNLIVIISYLISVYS